MVYGTIGTLATFLLLEIAAVKLVKNPKERGIFVQGGFRSNTGVMGLAFAMSAYGDEGIAVGSLYLMVTVIMFNALSVITLTRSLQRQSPEQKIPVSQLLRGIVTNPLIIGLLLGAAYGQSQLPMPSVIKQTGGFISSMALPLALLCAGASLEWRSMFRSSNVAVLSSVAKIFVVRGCSRWADGLSDFAVSSWGLFFCFPQRQLQRVAMQ